jgi:hypothetical protein
MSDKSQFQEKLVLLIVEKLVLALFVGVVLAVLSYWATRLAEELKSQLMLDRAREETAREQIIGHQAFVARQLNELYVPIQNHFAKDTAVWLHVFCNVAEGKPDPALAGTYCGDRPQKLGDRERRAIDEKFILPNHLATIAVMNEHSELVASMAEVGSKSVETFRQAWMRYEEHVAVYAALRAAGSTAAPGERGVGWPSEVVDATRARVLELQRQHQCLSAKLLRRPIATQPNDPDPLTACSPSP